MNISSETAKKIEELRLAESNLNTLLMQKQTYQVELNEANNALEEVKKTTGDIYKVSSNVMLKSDKKSILNELEEKKKILTLKINSIEKQENLFEQKSEKIKREVNEEISKNKK